MNDSINELASEWSNRLSNCHYAGEIYLSAGELNDLSRDFLHKHDVNKRHFDTVLLVLAVNCAYHYYDDEGFWKHFCTLLRCKNTTEVQYNLGEMIERRLRSLGLLRTERYGPFRYVGAILEQCGLSHKYIATFARIIKDMKNSMSIDYILSISQDDFKNRIEAVNCSRYLKRFLEDIAGWQFTLQVFRLVQLYEEGALNLDDLVELPGYPPDFWEELMSFLEITHKKKLKSSGFHFKPRLIFLANKSCPGLQFPSPQFIRNIIRPYGNMKWKYPVTLLEQNEMWSDQYSGYIYDEDGTTNRWIIKGWIPDGQPVLFDSINGYIDRQTIVQPGLYYLLAPFEYQPDCFIIKDLGPVKAHGKWKYRAYTVKLDAGEMLPGYSVLKTISGEEVELKWIKPEEKRLKYCSENFMDIFEGCLPEIHVSDFSLIENSITGMFYNIGNGTCRIRTRKDIIWFQEEVKKRVPVRGSVWLSNITRHRFSTGRSIAELHFTVLPERILNYQERIYGYNEEASISISNKTCPLHLDECKRLDHTGQLWSIPVTVNAASGFVKCGEITVGLNVPVYRAGIFGSDEKRIRYKCFSELDKDTVLTITGYPDSTGLLCLPGSGAGAATISIKFNNQGIATINAAELIEIAETSGYQVCEVTLEIRGETVSTGTILIELTELKNRIYQGELCNISFESEKNMSAILNVCSKICQNKIPGLVLNRQPEFCDQFDKWIINILACASVFDNSLITVGGEEPDWINKIDNKEIKDILLFYKRHITGIITNKPCELNLNILPGVERWHRKLNNILSLYSFEGIIRMLEEWANDIRKGRGPFHSQISNQQGGSILSRAWRQYLQKRYEKAIDLINNIENASDLVLDLKIFLHTLLLLRMARIKAAKEMILNACYLTELVSLNSGMKYLISVVSGNPVALQDNEGDILISVLPLDIYDRRILVNAANSYKQINDGLLENCNELNDWLIMLYVINLLDTGKKRSLMAAKLLDMENSIPPSPDKGDIIRQLTILQQGE